MVLESGIPRNVRECQKCVLFSLPGLGNFSWKLVKSYKDLDISIVNAQLLFFTRNDLLKDNSII